MNQAGIISKRNDGETALYRAAKDSDEEMVLLILASGAYLPASPEIGVTSIANQDEIEAVSPVLIGRIGQTENIVEDEKKKILYWAVLNGDHQLVEKFGADDFRSWTLGGANLWHVAASSRQQAANSRQGKILDSLLTAKIDIMAESGNGSLVLHLAAANGNEVVMEALLDSEKSKEPDGWVYTTTKETKEGETALYLAVRKNHRKVAELLWKEMNRVDFGANPEAAEKAFVWMARLEKPGQEEMLKRLYMKRKAQTSEAISEETDTWTTLHWAVYHGHCEVVWWLLARGGHMKVKEMKDAKDICNKKIPAANADGKRGKFGPEGDHTQDATPKMESEAKVYRLVSYLLQNPPFVLGPSAFYDNEEKPPLETLTNEKRSVCDEFATTIVDFYRREGRVDFLYRPCKSYDVIYGSGPEKIMSDAKRSDIRHLEVLRAVASVGRNGVPPKTAAPAPGRPIVRRATGLPSEKQEPKNPETPPSKKPKAQTSKSMEREESETPHADLGEFQFRWFHVGANNVS
jgi:ankyrin repeat protein